MGAKAYSYIRISSELQRKGDGQRRQRASAEKFALEEGLDLQPEVYEDLGFSAFKGEHLQMGALGRLERDLAEGKIEPGSFLLVESLDRLSRQDILTAFVKFNGFITAGLTIVTLADRQRYSRQGLTGGPEAFAPLLMSLSSMSLAHEESRKKSYRVGKAWANKRANAATTKLTRRGPGWLVLSSDRSKFEEIPERVEVVRKIFEDSRDGIGVFRIAKMLNLSKTPIFGRSKRGWHVSYIKKILMNRAVLGEYQSCETTSGKRVALEVVPDYYPQIISEELFYSVQSAKEARLKFAGRKGDSYANLFSGLVSCGKCGAAVRYLNKGSVPKKSDYKYFRCTAAILGHECTASSWAYQSFESDFFSYVEELDISAVVHSERRAQEAAEIKSRQRVVERKIQENEKSLDALVSMIGEIALESGPKNRLIRRMNELGSETDALKLESEDLSLKANSIKQPEQSPQSRKALLLELKSNMVASSGTELFNLRAKTAQIIKELVAGISMWPDGPDTVKAEVDLRARLTDRKVNAEAIESFVNDWRLSMRSGELGKLPYFEVTFRDGKNRQITSGIENWILKNHPTARDAILRQWRDRQGHKS